MVNISALQWFYFFNEMSPFLATWSRRLKSLSLPHCRFNDTNCVAMQLTWMCPFDSTCPFLWILKKIPKNFRAESESHAAAAAAKTNLTGCGDRWCTAVQTLFFFNLCLFHFVFRSGLQILGSDRTMRTVMFCFFVFFQSARLSPVSLESWYNLPAVQTAYLHC